MPDPDPPARLQQIRKEVRDKLFVVFNGCNSGSTAREIARQQCEDFLIELFSDELAALAQQDQELEGYMTVDDACKQYPYLSVGAAIHAAVINALVEKGFLLRRYPVEERDYGAAILKALSSLPEPPQ